MTLNDVDAVNDLFFKISGFYEPQLTQPLNSGDTINVSLAAIESVMRDQFPIFQLDLALLFALSVVSNLSSCS